MAVRNAWGKKAVCAALVPALAAGLLAGCGEQQVDYDVDGSGDSELSGICTLEQLRELDGELWRDAIATTDGNGDDLKVTISAEISVPDLDQMSVVEVCEQEFTAAFRRQVAEMFFGEEVYSAYSSREYLEDRISEDQLYLELKKEKFGDLTPSDEGYEGYMEDKEQLEREIEALEEYLAAATAELVPEEEFAADDYLGRIDGVWYELSFYTEYRDIELSVYEALASESDASESGESLSLGEALEQAKALLERTECYAGFSLKSQTEYTQEELESYDYAEVSYSGKFDEEEALGEFYNFTFYPEVVDGYDRIGYTGGGAASLFDFATVYVYSDGHYWILVGNPIALVSSTPVSSFLSLAHIKEIMVGEIADGWDLSRFNWNSSMVLMNHMELCYAWVENPDEAGSYSLLPVWVLRNSGNVELAANAIDGGVIGAEDTVGEE